MPWSFGSHVLRSHCQHRPLSRMHFGSKGHSQSRKCTDNHLGTKMHTSSWRRRCSPVNIGFIISSLNSSSIPHVVCGSAFVKCQWFLAGSGQLFDGRMWTANPRDHRCSQVGRKIFQKPSSKLFPNQSVRHPNLEHTLTRSASHFRTSTHHRLRHSTCLPPTHPSQCLPHNPTDTAL